MIWSGTIRSSNWHPAPSPSEVERPYAFNWCLEYTSKGKFWTFGAYTDSAWYFELEKDAIMFALKWGK